MGHTLKDISQTFQSIFSTFQISSGLFLYELLKMSQDDISDDRFDDNQY